MDVVGFVSRLLVHVATVAGVDYQRATAHVVSVQTVTNMIACVLFARNADKKIVYAPNIHLVAEVATMKSHFKNARYVNRQIVYVVHYVVVPANVVAVIIIPVHVAKVSDALIVEDIQMYRPVQYTVPLVLARLVRYAENEGVKKFMRTAREMPLPIKSLPMTITIY